MPTAPRQTAAPFRYRETTITLAASPVIVAPFAFDRVGLGFWLANPPSGLAIFGNSGRVAANQNVTANDGYPVVGTTPVTFFYSNWGSYVFEAFYGIIGFGTPILQILEVFYEPKR